MVFSFKFKKNTQVKLKISNLLKKLNYLEKKIQYQKRNARLTLVTQNKINDLKKELMKYSNQYSTMKRDKKTETVYSHKTRGQKISLSPHERALSSSFQKFEGKYRPIDSLASRVTSYKKKKKKKKNK